MEENRYLLYLLRIIEKEGNIYPLVEAGLEYAQVFNLIEVTLKEGLTKKEGGRLILTELGKGKIIDLNKKFGNRNSSLWIEPEIKSQIEKISDKDVYLPRKTELTFRSE